MKRTNRNNKDKIVWCVRWGAIIGLVGGVMGAIGGGISLWDRFIESDLLIKGVAPIVTWDKIKEAGDYTFYGISLIADLQNRRIKPAYIIGADIHGKVYLSYEEFRSICINDHPSIIEDKSRLSNHKLNKDNWLASSAIES